MSNIHLIATDKNINYKIIIPQEEPKQKCTCERPDDNTCEYCEQQSSIQILEQAVNNLKGKELFKESNDRARKILSKSLPIETLEAAAENAFDDFKRKNPIVPQKHIFPYKLGYIEGAKWQQERMYSEEEVYNLIKAFNKHTLLIRHLEMGNSLDVNEWFEQFKKK
jgi:hypothetical protein